MRFIFYLCLAALFTACQNKQENHKYSPTEQKAIYISSQKGKVWNVFGVKITGKILSEDTHGTYAVILTETPPGGGPPKHIHEHEDELFYILKGKYTFYCGKDTIETNEGDYVRLPKGIPHRFKNRDTHTGITMNTITPGGFEQFFEDVATLKEQKKLNRQKIDSIATSYGISFVKD